MKTSWRLRVGAIMAVLLLSATMAQAVGTQLLVANVRTQQRPFTATWDVTYDLETVGDMAVTVSLYLSMDSGATYPILCATVSGDVGADVLPDPGLWPRKHIVWNAGADFPGLSSSTCRLRVTADDGLSEIPEGFVTVLPGTFMMGSPTDELGRSSNETSHTVTLTHGFYIASTEVTEEWWDDVMGSGSSTSQRPKAYVSWDAAVAFCNQLSLNEGLTPVYTINGPVGDVTWNREANGYRLPTEAEWEYACRAGSQAAFCNGPVTYTGCTLDPNLDQVGWYCGNSGSVSHDVGQKSTNAWGLYDMHGNLFEWVWDGYRSDYENLPSQDPAYDVGPVAQRVLRGGDWSNDTQECRSAFRGRHNAPSTSDSGLGFRPARSAY